MKTRLNAETVGAQWLLAVAALLGNFASAIAAPSVAWSPPSVSVSLKPNESTTRVVRLTVKDSVALASMRITPSLKPYIAVNPTTVRDLVQGQSVNVTLTLSLPIDAAAGLIDGTLQLRSIDSSGQVGPTVARPLPVTIGVTCPCLPPDPGTAGMATLEGIDSNADGIRDDLERYIAISYPSAPNARLGLRQLASVLQSTLAARFSTSAARALVPKINGASECLLAVMPDAAEHALVALENRLANTKERLQAYADFNSQLNGGYFPASADGSGATACDFPVN